MKETGGTQKNWKTENEKEEERRKAVAKRVDGGCSFYFFFLRIALDSVPG